MGGLAYRRLAAKLVNLVRHLYSNVSSTLTERKSLDQEQLILCISLCVFTHSVTAWLSPLVGYLDMVGKGFSSVALIESGSSKV